VTAQKSATFCSSKYTTNGDNAMSERTHYERRELVAAMLLQGMLSNPNTNIDDQQLVTRAVERADELMDAVAKVRKKSKGDRSLITFV
jgi:hypothetical protein